MAARGWLTKFKTKRSGWIWVHHRYRTNPKTGKRAETTCNLGPVAQLTSKENAWQEVQRRHLLPNTGQVVSGRVTFAELTANYRKKSLNKLAITTQATTNHNLDHYLLPRWGDSFALEIKVDDIEEWLDSLPLANRTKDKIRCIMNVVYWRAQKSGLLPKTGEGNPVAFVTQSSESNYEAVIVRPEQAFQILMELEEPHRTLVFLVAVTGLRISEALALQWRDLDYQHHEIRLHRVRVGINTVEKLKTKRSRSSVPLGGLLADVLQRWYEETIYSKPEDWVFASTKLKGKIPMSASIMAADKLRPAAIKAGICLKLGQRFGFHNFRHSLATFLISRGENVKTIQELLRHSKSSTTLDLYSQAIDSAKLAAQEEIASAINNAKVARTKPKSRGKKAGEVLKF